MNNKKIVIIAPYLNILPRGIERFCQNLSDAMVRHGIDVVLYVWGAKKGTPCGNINSKIKIRTVPYFRYYRENFALLCYRLWLRIDCPDTTILNYLYHGEEYLPKDRHYIYVLHSPASQIRNRYEYAQKHIKPFKKINIVGVSEFVCEEAKTYFEGIPMNRIYNGIDTNSFQINPQKPTFGKLRLITAAAYEERKGMHWMIKALANYQHKEKIKYDIYGTGDKEYGDYLAKLIKECHLEDVVSLKGGVSNLPEIEPNYDLAVLLSHGEAFGLSFIEGMACGLPAMTSTFQPFPELVKQEYGFMVDRENPKEIQDVLTQLIENPELLKNMSVAARKAAEDFSWDKIVEQYIKLI